MLLTQTNEELRKLEQSGVEQTDDYAACHDDEQYNTGIDDHSVSARPGDVLESSRIRIGGFLSMALAMLTR